MMMQPIRRGLLVSVLGAVLASAGAAQGAEGSIAVGEVVAPPATIDPASIRDTAEGEIRRIDPAALPRRRYVVSLALVSTASEGPVSCRVNATLRDALTGNMVAIIEGGARAEGPASAEVRREVAHAAIRSAVRRIPRALASR
jgi:hypothetical protein